ncbi:heme lyase CcmF/NrfE family subunit [Inhella sp.]|uniref:heme lyase CcmF/NrfE family subunit n=1 Tax=Inhella sp. TaxID=1921806 RepID=UPI0035AF03D2
MIVELGHLLLWFALGLALWLGRGCWQSVGLPEARRGGTLLALFVLAGFAALSWAFAAKDFSVAYVAQHAHSDLPLAYRLAGVWGGHEGSLLLWVSLLVSWQWVLTRARLADEALHARSLAVLALLAAGFLLFMLATSNPFERILPPLPEGRDLNPLLQDPGMVLHPPLLYMGYVGFAVSFALAVGALLQGEVTPAWARAARPWVQAAWAFLTLGIALGSFWAYYELGWGGWWFWDPVENASFMPWLAGTALLHSLAVTDKRGAFKAWSVLLALLAFALSLLGTFLVRSGVLSSVHAFATDPQRGLFILAFLVVVVGGALSLYGARAARLGLGARFGLLSRETGLLANNAMLLAVCGAVLLGTLYPLFLDALTGQKISVGPPYFEAVFVPLMAPLLLLLGVGPALRWGQADAPSLWQRLRLPLLLTPLAVGLAAWGTGARSAGALMGLALAAWVLLTALFELWPKLRERRAPARSVAAMLLGHAGIGVFIVGVTLVGSLQQTRDLAMAPGERVEMAGLRFELVKLEGVQGPNYEAMRGTLRVWEGERLRAELFPEKRAYPTSEMPMTEAGIARSWRGDIYVSLAEPLPENKGWIVHLATKPFVNWIWGGCLLMALGAFLAASDRRYRGGRA